MNAVIHKKVDVFAFAVSMYEVVTKSEAWSEEPDKNAIMKSILDKQRPKFNPTCIQKYHDIPMIFDIIKMAWAHRPQDRPEFNDIMGMLLEMVSKKNIQDGTFTSTLRSLQDQKSLEEREYI